MAGALPGTAQVVRYAHQRTQQGTKTRIGRTKKQPGQAESQQRQGRYAGLFVQGHAALDAAEHGNYHRHNQQPVKQVQGRIPDFDLFGHHLNLKPLLSSDISMESFCVTLSKCSSEVSEPSLIIRRKSLAESASASASS